MIIRAYSILDLKAQNYMLPFFQHTDPLAIRSFAANVQEPGSMMHKFPADFQLYFVGTYDDQSGAFVSAERQLVASGEEHA